MSNPIYNQSYNRHFAFHDSWNLICNIALSTIDRYIGHIKCSVTYHTAHRPLISLLAVYMHELTSSVRRLFCLECILLRKNIQHIQHVSAILCFCEININFNKYKFAITYYNLYSRYIFLWLKLFLLILSGSILLLIFFMAASLILGQLYSLLGANEVTQQDMW